MLKVDVYQSLQIPKEILDDIEDDTYPPMIKLDIERAPTSGTPSNYIYIDVTGVEGKKKFGLCPKLPQGRSLTPIPPYDNFTSPLCPFSVFRVTITWHKSCT